MAEDITPEAEAKHPGGRPLKFETAADLDLAIQTYFDECDPHIINHMEATGFNERGQTMFAERKIMSDQKPYTMSGLARALGISRQGLLDYSKRDEFVDSVQAAKQRCEEYAESQLFGPYANGAKFNLINNHRGKYQAWADKQELTGANDAPLMPVALDAAIIARRTNGKTAPSTETDSEEPS